MLLMMLTGQLGPLDRNSPHFSATHGTNSKPIAGLCTLDRTKSSKGPEWWNGKNYCLSKNDGFVSEIQEKESFSNERDTSSACDSAYSILDVLTLHSHIRADPTEATAASALSSP